MQSERDSLRDITKVDALPLVCPVCNFFFVSWEAKAFGYETRRTDFRPNYQGDNPMKLYYHLCTKCKFCADQEYFRLEIHWAKRMALEDGIEELYMKYGEDITRSMAAKLYYGAHIGELLDKLGLIDESLHDRTMAYVQAFWWSEQEEAKKFGEGALEKLKETAGQVEKGSEEYIYTIYMIGEISRRLGRGIDARLYFEQLLTLREKHQHESNRFIFDLARQQMAGPRDLMPEESLNPYKDK
jgi:uncharacterized protein (DUF2225 family)